jgi:hypothetical protein
METNIVQESFRVNYFFKIEHFSEVIEKTDVEAALAAVIFHREEVPIEAVKDHMRKKGIETLIAEVSVHIKKPFHWFGGAFIFLCSYIQRYGALLGFIHDLRGIEN